jgi:hypothetical protein
MPESPPVRPATRNLTAVAAVISILLIARGKGKSHAAAVPRACARGFLFECPQKPRQANVHPQIRSRHSFAVMNTSRFGNASKVAAGVPKFTANTSAGWPAIHCETSTVS